jgi:hypothetical protein
MDVYTQGRKFVHVDIEPTQIGRVFGPDLGIVSDAKAALELFVEVAREYKHEGKLPDYSVWADQCRERKRTLLRRTDYDNVPIKPQRVYAEMNKAFGNDVCYVSNDRVVADRSGAVSARTKAAALDQLRAGGPAWMDAARCARRVRRRPDAAGRCTIRRLRLPVHDRGAGCRRAVQDSVPARAGEQRVPRSHPAGAAQLQHGFLR